MTDVSDLRAVRAIVCEDEPLARQAMERYLRDVGWIDVVAMAGDGKESLRLINKHEPDLVFLDVRMPGMSGLEVLEALDHRPAVVFTTAFDEYAIQAFEHGAVDYLVKPFGRDRLVQTLDRVRVRLLGEAGSARPRGPEEVASGQAQRYLERVFARHRKAIVPVPVADILHLEAVDGGSAVHTSGGTLSMDSPLSEVESRLDPADFVRVHRAHVVNLARVRAMRRYDDRRLQITLEDGTRIVASRAGSKALRAMIE